MSTLMYYSKSKDSAPGKGAGETLDAADDFSELSKIPTWRQILSAFYKPAAPLVFKERKYASREHAYHAAKFPEHPEFQRLFEIDSGSVFAQDPVLAKSAGGKGGVVRVSIPVAGGKAKKTTVFTRPKRVKADPVVMGQLQDVMEAIMLCEFRQDELARRVLLATRSAVLTHNPGRGAKTVTEHGLMRVRSAIRDDGQGRAVPSPLAV